MKRQIIQTSFASGEIMPEMFGRGDLATYDNGAKALVNVNVLSTGGVRRRSGTQYIAHVNGTARLYGITTHGVPYMTVWTVGKVTIYRNRTKVSEIATPFGNTQILQKLFFATDTHAIWVCCGDIAIQKLAFNGKTWHLSAPSFSGLEKNIFSTANGYPVAMGFIQGRTVLAGTKAHPNRIWMSRSGKPLDFTLNKGLDDDGIDMVLLSSGNNTITSVFCASELMVFTTAGEWIVSGLPITPSSVVARQHTRVGSPHHICTPIVDADGLIVFVSGTQNSIHAYKQDNSGNGVYVTQPIASMARHMIKGITDMTYSPKHNRVLCVKADGTMAVLTIDKAEGLSAWTRYETTGAFIACAANGDGIYTVVNRYGTNGLEIFSKTALMDSVHTHKTLTATDTIGNLARFNGRKVCIVADGIVANAQTVKNDHITLTYPVTECHVGYGYTHRIQSLPLPSPMANKKIRMRKVIVRLQDTASAIVHMDNKAVHIGFKTFGMDVLSTPVPLFSGDKVITVLGWKVYGHDSIWTISGNTPLPLTVLSIKAEISTT